MWFSLTLLIILSHFSADAAAATGLVSSATLVAQPSTSLMGTDQPAPTTMLATAQPTAHVALPAVAGVPMAAGLVGQAVYQAPGYTAAGFQQPTAYRPGNCFSCLLNLTLTLNKHSKDNMKPQLNHVEITEFPCSVS